MMKRLHKFRVECETRQGETLAVTGSSPELGSWSKPGLILLQQTEERDVWEGEVELCTESVHDYRYCVVVVLQPNRFIVRRWETHAHPRTVTGTETTEDVFGKCDGVVSVQRGWLTEEMVVQFKLRDTGLNIWKRKFAGHRFWIKMTPVDQELASNHEHEESLDVSELRMRYKNYPIVETACLSEEGCEREVQDQFGIQANTLFTLFEVQLLSLTNVAFLVDVYGRAEGRRDTDLPDHVGMCYIHSDSLRDTEGKVEATITSIKHQPIGRLVVDYLVINPVENLNWDFSASKRTMWNKDWSALDVGHRGLGNSYTNAQHCSNIRENTIASMNDAVLHGADMVEFDVQVSSDLVPVIYHEFTLCVQSKTKAGGSDIMLEVPVKDLTVAQLHGLKVHHPSEKSAGVKEFIEVDQDHAAFPTLESALHRVDQSCGFNIEVKFPQKLKNGQHEHKDMMEMNLFIDQVLRTVFAHGQDRKIVFSTFAPDICSMLINKQNRYPVLLLTQGVDSGYDDFLDPRTWTIQAAQQFCQMAGIQGISARADDLIRDTNQIQNVKSKNLVLFSWTDHRNDKETVQYLKELGVDGIIYDRMDQNNSKQVKESIFLTETRRKGASDSGHGSEYSPASSPTRSDPASPSSQPAASSAAAEPPKTDSSLPVTAS